jgi:molybdopterin synthase sulfur carrier subunit
MPIRVQIPGPCGPLTGGASEVEVEGRDVAGLIAALDSRHQGVRDRLLDGSGALRRHVRVFVNDEDVRALQQEATPLQPGGSGCHRPRHRRRPFELKVA